jgi:hypothetical protein
MKLPRYLSRWSASRHPRATSRRSKRPLSRRPLFEALETRRVLTTFMVTNTDDSGAGSLRQAILDANTTANVGGVPDEIHFDIPGSGVHTIFPTGEGQPVSLPVINDPVIIDGYTQGQATADPSDDASPNTLPVGDNAVLKIEINGTLLGTTATRLFVFGGSASGSTVRGLAITHVPYASFQMSENGPDSADNITIAGNFIGTDAAGLTYQGGGPAVLIVRGSGNHIGGPDPADRNVIAPDSFVFTASITMDTATNNVIEGNYIGVNKDGTAPLQAPAGGFAIDLSGNPSSDHNTVTGNVIFATLTGIKMPENNGGHNTIAGNFIGTNATGTAGLGGGQFGIDLQSHDDIITGNLISGFSIGIQIHCPAPGPTIQGNKIGTDITGTSAIPNTDGITVTNAVGASPSAMIGGTNPGEGNTIAFNSRYGVLAFTGNGSSIRGNSIFSNGSLGISLTANSSIPLVNDPGDTDTGSNGWQNYPILTAASVSVGHTFVTGTLNTTANSTFRIEFFASKAADPAGFGEGQFFLGFTNVTTEAAGDASFNVDLLDAVAFEITATATDADNNTSEFSQAVTAAGSLDVIIDASTPQSFLDSLTVIHGSLIMTGVAGRTSLILPNLTNVDGDVIITGNPDLTTISLPLLTTVGGNIDISNNPALTAVNLGGVTTVGGSVSASGNTAATSIDLASLATVGGSVSASGNTAATSIDLGSLTTVSGSVSASGNTAATSIDLASLATVGGSVSASGNTAATSIDLGSLTTVSGSVSVSGNTGATSIDLASLATVGGDETVEAQDSITSVTADGSTEVTLFSTESQMTASLATGTFADPVAFTVTRLDPASLPPEPGQDSTGAVATIDPLAAYHFNFAIPTLGQDATLSFEINVSALSTTDRDAFLAALAAGNATLAVKNDALDSVYQAFAIAAPGQPADATHVTVVRLDASGNPLPDGSTDTPATVRFAGVTGHFSNFAVVIVTPSANSPPVAMDDSASLTAGTSVNIAVLANDSDPEGDALTVTTVTQPADGHGTVTINADGTLTYTQTVFANGTETFTYTISDGHDNTATATVTVTINLPASVGIDMLLSQVNASSLKHGRKTALSAKLHSAQHSLAKHKLRAAKGQMTAFKNQVRAFKRNHILPTATADLWLFEAQNILAAIS